MAEEQQCLVTEVVEDLRSLGKSQIEIDDILKSVKHPLRERRAADKAVAELLFSAEAEDRRRRRRLRPVLSYCHSRGGRPRAQAMPREGERCRPSQGRGQRCLSGGGLLSFRNGEYPLVSSSRRSAARERNGRLPAAVFCVPSSTLDDTGSCTTTATKADSREARPPFASAGSNIVRCCEGAQWRSLAVLHAARRARAGCPTALLSPCCAVKRRCPCTAQAI